jgi:hypothetical protein
MDASTYRRVMTGLLVALVSIVTIVLVLDPTGEEPDLPDPLEEVFPLPGDTVVQQTVVSIDLPVGYDIELEIDGVRIPRTEIGAVAATGRWSWGPGPNRLWSAWEPGEHTVTVRWDRTSGRPDPGEFTWTFRVT